MVGVEVLVQGELLDVVAGLLAGQGGAQAVDRGRGFVEQDEVDLDVYSSC